MDRFQLMTVFVAVAEEESFAGGARRLSMSPPAVTRAIAMLETRLGIKLLTRTTRHVRATDAGLRYLDSARRILADAEEADEAAAGIHAAPRGHLAVTAPVLFGSMFVTPAIVGYLERYPDVTLNAVFLDRVVNLLEEGLDVGVRIGELPDSSMRAIPVGHVRRVVCAAPDYLACHGEPDEPQALAGHRLINASTVSPASEWRFGNASNGIAVKIQPRLTVTNNEAAIQAALRGFGITRLISYQVAAHLAAGRLKRILVAHEPAPLPIHVLHREGRQASAKVRSFVDFLVGI
ncbi:MAG: LysR family transcriptional regulator [Dechloromonas sp.]|uniref:LysR family transcriptional regulator n=1 Tax=Candidatus Dechloromonas phosphorivorans TaxID=2899244 RepID=A0A935JZU5_9RHOO|nr:LysR family transcriptional regulator [Candidatus Dechloromonas phosphorivorans]